MKYRGKGSDESCDGWGAGELSGLGNAGKSPLAGPSFVRVNRMPALPEKRTGRCGLPVLRKIS